MADKSVADRLPLLPVDFLVLMILAGSDLHGYGLVKEIERRTEGGISILPGNFYVVLRRLLRDGLIAQSNRRASEKTRGRPRRYYRITSYGREVVSAEARRLKDLLEAAGSAELIGETP